MLSNSSCESRSIVNNMDYRKIPVGILTSYFAITDFGPLKGSSGKLDLKKIEDSHFVFIHPKKGFQKYT